jgi:hypothetical protein
MIIEPTKKTPWVILEPGKIFIMGRSIPENPSDFYRPIHEWIANYIRESNNLTSISLGFEFINTTSIKWIYTLLKELSKIPNMAISTKISWYYEQGDEDMCDLGLILRSLVDCPFSIIEVDEMNKKKYEQLG